MLQVRRALRITHAVLNVQDRISHFADVRRIICYKCACALRITHAGLNVQDRIVHFTDVRRIIYYKCAALYASHMLF